MQELTVKYKLSDKDIDRLNEILIAYSEKQGIHFENIEAVFQYLMEPESANIIEENLLYGEYNSGLKES